MAKKANERASRPDDDNPEWTKDDFTKARPATEALPEFIGEKATEELMRRGRGRPPKPNKKVNQTLRLDTDVRGYLMYLENVRILSGTQRELVIDRLMALEADEIDIEQVKWVVLMVLFSQPGQESAYAQMEDLVFEERSDALH